MSRIRLTRKQKQSRSRLYYSLLRSLYQLVPFTSSGRKRRFLVAGIITFSGIFVYHSVPHNHRSSGHHPASSPRSLLSDKSGDQPYLRTTGYNLNSAPKLSPTAVTGMDTYQDSSHYLTRLYVKSQSIRGSPA